MRRLAWTGFACLVAVCLVPTVLAQGPRTGSYDGSGLWHYVLRINNNSLPGLHPGDVIDEGDFVFTGDGEGNLYATEGITQIALMRRGEGRTIPYAMSVYEDHPTCDTNLSGVAHIDTDTDTMHATVSGIEEGCTRVVFKFTATRVGPGE